MKERWKKRNTKKREIEGEALQEKQEKEKRRISRMRKGRWIQETKGKERIKGKIEENRR